MSGNHEAVVRNPLILGNKTYHQMTEDICRPIEGKANKYWWVAFVIAFTTMIWGITCLSYTIGTGIGSWGANKTVGWAWDITNFVWWIGIGHAGTLISAILLLFRQRWRMSINRSAEAMTIFAVVCAGLFPLFHTGRPWLGWKRLRSSIPASTRAAIRSSSAPPCGTRTNRPKRPKSRSRASTRPTAGRERSAGFPR